jgi:acyl-CoA reductase-like NAD-dependent aldehyde dehydrogenase
VVDRTVEGAVLDRLRAKVEALPLGPVDDPAAAVGPLISERSRDSIHQALAESQPERIFGGQLPDDDRFARGYFFAPLVIRLAGPDAPLAQRELFGPVTDSAAAIGPVISERSRDSILVTLESLDAEPYYRATVPESDEYRRGWWVPPTVIRNVDADSELARRELFGPVLAELTADDLEHAITLANDTSYGLSATIAPTADDPVKLIPRTSGDCSSGVPTAGPVPMTTLNTPAGRFAAAAVSARSVAMCDDISDGLSTTVVP